MRLILLTLLLIVVVDSSLLDKAKGLLTSGRNIGQKFKNATIQQVKKLFDKTPFLKTREKLRSLKGKMLKALQLTSAMAKSLGERLKKWLPFKRDRVRTNGDNINEINAHGNVSKIFYQGDIGLSENQTKEVIEEIEELSNSSSRAKRQAFKDIFHPQGLWKQGVNFFFHSSATDAMKNAFLKAAKWWEKDTCIDFIENENAYDRIMVFKQDGCWSSVGKKGGLQRLSLGDGCEVVCTTAHEIGHALGFWHTQSRTDRDEYVTINIKNVEEDFIDQFNKETTRTNYNYGMKYDYGSIMHYGATTGSLNEDEPTLVPFDINYRQTLGSPFISFIELSMLNEHYGCKGRCIPSISAKCQMGGFPHPRNCSKCICPGGYGGDLCTERPSGCGRTIQASPAWEKLEDAIGLGGKEQQEFETCWYWIESPEGTNIEVKILYFTKGVSVDGCAYAGVEIKTNEDQTMTGYRFCSPDAAGTTLRSHSNRVPVMTFNRIGTTRVVLEFRHVPSSKPTESEPSSPVSATTKELLGVSTMKPSGAIITDSPVKTGSGFRCVDNSSCLSLVKTGFCTP
ncbi:Zinc metalloproteinase [Trichostrongylus colubriformis]|uniref:Zinc metalloproteinase n=1 Tax=Trichostrongylus colubriformis TaxID=6319 RepID=A0AAN8FZA6_TRICO